MILDSPYLGIDPALKMTFSPSPTMIPSPPPSGDLSGRVLRSGVPDPPVVRRLPIKIHRLRGEAQVHQEAHMHHRLVTVAF